jgi:hypothetical protein
MSFPGGYRVPWLRRAVNREMELTGRIGTRRQLIPQFGGAESVEEKTMKVSWPPAFLLACCGWLFAGQFFRLTTVLKGENHGRPMRTPQRPD